MFFSVIMERMFLLILLLAFREVLGDDTVAPDLPSSSITFLPQSYPSCFNEKMTWSPEEATEILPGIHSAYSCQDLCLDSPECRKFTWYDGLETPFNFVCFLYEQTTKWYPCTNCVSGPQSCTCSAYFSCQYGEDNFIGQFPHVDAEILCQDHCLVNDECRFYTWLDENSPDFPNFCLLFSSCDEKVDCRSCRSGPADCGDISVITSTTTARPHLSCFDEDTTWSFDEISTNVPDIDSPTSCQLYCQNNPSSCTDFTWFTELAFPFPNMCALFLYPSTPTPCSDCVSGPLSCLCGSSFACEVEFDNLVDTITSVQNELICQEECAQSPRCNFYTYFDISSHPFNQICFLFSSCDHVDFSCEGCSSGPDDCRNIIHISTPQPSSTTISPTTTTVTTSTTTPSFSFCEIPEPPNHGDWFCLPSSYPSTCHLECDPGYVSNNATVITCHYGEWSSNPSCLAAIALITGSQSHSHAVEVYGESLHTKLPDLPEGRYGHTLDVVNSLVLLCGGGKSSRHSCLALNSSQQWTQHSTTIASRSSHASVSMLGKLHLLTGYDARSSTEVLQPPSDQWHYTWGINEYDWGTCAAKIQPDVLIITGGWIHGSSVISYNATTGEATRLQNLINRRAYHGCVYVKNPNTKRGGVLVAGGTYGGSSSEMFDITSGEWSTTGQLTSIRQQGMRMVVIGETILAMGGLVSSEEGALSTVDKFNLTSLQWTTGESMLEPRNYHAVAGVPPNAVGIGRD